MAKIMSCFKQLNQHLLPTYRHREAFGRLRQAIALPVYAVGLVLVVAYAVALVTLLTLTEQGSQMTEWPPGPDDY
jgi:hypothetical protein